MRPPQVDERHFGNERSRLMPGRQQAVVGPTHDVARPRIRVGDIRFSRFVIDALDLSTYSRRTRADSLSTRPPRCTTSLARGRSANRHRRTGRSLARRDRSWIPFPSPQPQSTVCRCQIVRFPGHPTGFPTDGAVLVSVRPRTSRERTLPTTLDRFVSDLPWIEAQGRAAAPPGADGRGQTVPFRCRA
jgi:hypothetical protein